ncbi:MAG TPA: EAL domain-containing protein [Pseudorhodoplanes sp.]|nr:EAL domain-containing protein [Pseudorhodoplanes sp.]
MHKLLAKQVAKATASTGVLDIDALATLVGAAYEELERDRRRSEHSIAVMIDELNNAHTQLNRAHARLSEAFDIIPEALVLLDAEGRYVLWNQRFAEMYDTVRDKIVVGGSFEDSVRAGVQRGHYPEAIGREEEWLGDRLSRNKEIRNTQEQQLAGGRWVRIEERRTADGGSIGVRIDITELKQREESFKLLFDANPIPMWIWDHETFKFLAVNDAAIGHYGYSRERFLDMSIFDIRPAEDHEAVRNITFNTLGDHRTDRTWRHIKADGNLIHVSVYARSLCYNGRNASLAAAIDITARKKAEDEARNTREFLETVIENVPVSIIVKNADDLRYVLVNRAAEQYLGLSREELVGKSVHELFERSCADEIFARDQELLETEGCSTLEGYTVQTPRNGARIVNSKRLTIRGVDGQPKYLLVMTEDVTEKIAAEARIKHLAHHDPLTSLPNRASFNAHFDEALDRARATGKGFAALCIDLDRFKEVNDVFGHNVGDSLLCQVATRLREIVGDAFIARIGGDEFTIILQDDRPDAAAIFAQRLLDQMARDFDIDGRLLRAGLSIGIAIYPNDGKDAATLLSNADAALYRAKADGRGTIRFFEAEMDERLRERRAIQQDMQSAIARNELELYYQPQAKIDGEVVGFEALVRWRHPQRGLVSPMTFIPIAEESGLIVSIGEWVLREACREAATWSKSLRVAVNLSPVQFRHGDLPTLMHAILLETGLAADRVELEITEGVLMTDFARALSVLRRLKTLGVRIAMDDFGTGYSSLSYLQSFPFDKIKIDQAFISNLDDNRHSAAIVRAVVSLAHGLDLPVVAEGVESSDQLDFLTRETVDEVQGYLIGRPCPIAHYAELTGDQAQSPKKLARFR